MRYHQGKYVIYCAMKPPKASLFFTKSIAMLDLFSFLKFSTVNFTADVKEIYTHAVFWLTNISIFMQRLDGNQTIH